MSLAFGMAFGLVLVIGIGGALVLYLLVRAEHDTRQRMDRESAERAARKDSPDRDEKR